MGKKILFILLGLVMWQDQMVAANPLTWMRSRYHQWWADRTLKTLAQLQRKDEHTLVLALFKNIDQLEDIAVDLRPDQQMQLKQWQAAAGYQYRKVADRYLNRISAEYAVMQKNIQGINPSSLYEVPYIELEVSGVAYIDLLHELVSKNISDYLNELDGIKKYLNAEQMAQIDRWRAIVKSMK